MVFPDKQNCYILLQFVFPACRNKWVDKWQLQKKTRVGQRERKLIWKWTLVSATEMEYDLTWGKVSDIYENKKVFWSLWWTFYSGHFLLASCDDDRLKGTVMNLGIIATKENGGQNKRPWNSFSPNRRKLKCFEALPNDEFSCNSKEVPQEQCKSAHEF